MNDQVRYWNKKTGHEIEGKALFVEGANKIPSSLNYSFVTEFEGERFSGLNLNSVPSSLFSLPNLSPTFFDTM